MQLNQRYKLTPKIQSLLNILEGQKIAMSLIPPRSNGLQHELRMSQSLHTATGLEKLAIQNLVDTYAWLNNLPKDTELDLGLIKTLHAKLLKNLRSDAGELRSEQTAIFNRDGQAVYLTPKPEEIEPLLTYWFKQIMYSDHNPIVQAIISHYQFEKIHPFKGGNGRVGRLILAQQLRQHGFDFHSLVSIEAIIQETKDTYLHYLESLDNDLTDFVEYLLSQITLWATNAIHQMTSSAKRLKVSGSLLPRRQEILNTIQEHSPCNFDFIHRRFMMTPASTIRYDLLKLQKDGYIKKLGVTNGALYSSVPTE
jgi:Fic family protein